MWDMSSVQIMNRNSVPEQKRTITLPYITLLKHEAPRFVRAEVDSMIDIALLTKDEEWINELTAMKEMLPICEVTPIS